MFKSTAGPVGALAQVIEPFAGFALEVHAFVLAIGVVFNVDRAIIDVAEVDLPAYLFGNTGGERDGSARLLVAIGIHRSDALHVAAVREQAPREILKAIPVM